MSEKECSEGTLEHLKRMVRYYGELYKVQVGEKPDHETIRELSVPLAKKGLECIEEGERWKKIKERIDRGQATTWDLAAKSVVDNVRNLSNLCSMSTGEYRKERSKELGFRFWIEGMSKEEADKNVKDQQRWDCIHGTESLRAGMHRNISIGRSYSEGCKCDWHLIFMTLQDLDIRPDLAEERLKKIQKEIRGT